MAITEKIQQRLDKLPPSLQAEVLDFVEYLLDKTERDMPKAELKAWSDLSLTIAVRGMETEETPSYTTADLKQVF